MPIPGIAPAGLKTVEMAANSRKLGILRKLLGDDTFQKTIGKTVIGSRAFKNKENSLVENIIDSLTAGHSTLLASDIAMKKLTGKNLRESFTDSGVTELAPEYFASRFLSF